MALMFKVFVSFVYRKLQINIQYVFSYHSSISCGFEHKALHFMSKTFCQTLIRNWIRE